MSSSHVSWHVNKSEHAYNVTLRCIKISASGTLPRRWHYLIPCSHNFSCSQPHTYCKMLFMFSGFSILFLCRIYYLRSALILSTLNSAVMHNLKYSPCKNIINSSLENNVVYIFCNYINNQYTGRFRSMPALCTWKISHKSNTKFPLKTVHFLGIREWQPHPI